MDHAEEPTASPMNKIFGGIAYVLALILVAFGIWAIGGAILFAWGLLSDPGSIGYFAKYFLETTKIAAQLPGAGEGLAHYVSWVVVVLLLLVLGKLGAWAVAAGAQLLQPRVRSRG